MVHLGLGMALSAAFAILCRVLIAYLSRRVQQGAAPQDPDGKFGTTPAPPAQFTGHLDLVPRHNLARKALDAVGHGCCPLFDFVTAQQDLYGKQKRAQLRAKTADGDAGKEDSEGEGYAFFGRTLDAGTGGHSLDWLCSLKEQGAVESVWAVTGDVHRERSMRKQFGGRLREVLTSDGSDIGEVLPNVDDAELGQENNGTEDLSDASRQRIERKRQLLNRARDRIFTGNWRNEKMLQGEVFDVVIADYLLGSVDAFAPYFQDRLLTRLRQHVMPDGRLYFIGMEPWPDREAPVAEGGSEHGQLIIDIAKARDACILLAGERPYREYPMAWVLRNLKQSGFDIVTVGFFEIVHSKSFVEKQISVAETKLSKIGSAGVADAMGRQLKDLRSRVRSLKWGVSYGDDYVIVAKPRPDSSSSEAATDVTGTSFAGASANGDNADPDASHMRKRSRKTIEEQDLVFPIDDESRD